PLPTGPGVSADSWTAVESEHPPSSSQKKRPEATCPASRRAFAGRCKMGGYIRECDLDQADEVFPGILRFFLSLDTKPRTFLELLSQFEHWVPAEREHPGRRPIIVARPGA